MSLLGTLIRLRDRGRLEAIAHELAAGVSNAVVRAVLVKALSMSPAEARGYVRVKSAPHVAARLAAFFSAHPTFPVEARPELTERLTEAVVALVAQELRVRPALETSLRRAA